MEANDASSLTEIQRLLLMAAAWHGLGPTLESKFGSTLKVVGRASLWLGVEAQEIDHFWRRAAFDCDEGESPPFHSRTEGVYDQLVKLIRDISPAVMKGDGNWGASGKYRPAHPYFNACRLTELGEQIATELLTKHPQYQKSMEKTSD